MTIYIKLKPRTAVIPFEIEMTLEEFLGLKPTKIANIMKSVEFTEKVIMDLLYKKEVKNHVRRERT